MTATPATALKKMQATPKQKWWTASLLATHLFGPLCTPQQQAAATKALAALAQARKIYAADNGTYRLLAA